MTIFGNAFQKKTTVSIDTAMVGGGPPVIRKIKCLSWTSTISSAPDWIQLDDMVESITEWDDYFYVRYTNKNKVMKIYKRNLIVVKIEYI